MEFEIHEISQSISLENLKKYSENGYVHMIKVVVDLENKKMSVGGEMHFDNEQALL